ncbi:ABC transporter ATP-binding protein [Hyphococcus sp. DH-69]|uniref:ABC transporter ATP-binding protein n=1 Tax=Hyphococcus formosus TaxID=3143534 RepID=UPI00398BBC54
MAGRSHSSDPVVLDQITKRYGNFTAVDNLSFRVAQGEIYGFLGPNGAGKTTTLRMLLDIVKPTTGSISVLGASSAINVRRKIGYLPEERGLYRKMKAVDSISYFAQLRGLPSGKAKRRANELLEQFGLEKFAKSKNEALSKGMAQKVQLLATIAHEPELLILDEPFSGLDPINQQTLEALISDQRANGRTIIFSTHVMQHAERLCDRFLILAHGQKRFEGTLEAARALYGHRLHVRSAAPPEAFERLAGVISVRLEKAGGDENLYEIELADNADPQSFLRQVVGAGIQISRFEQAGATLHEIFVSLAGDEAATSDLAEAAE